MVLNFLGDVPFMEFNQLSILIFRFILNISFSYVLIDLIYKKINQDREFIFTFYLFNILIFFVSSLLVGVKMKTGFAFGLFAIFSILRYRTEPIRIKEMTFLFINIILAVMNSLITKKIPLSELLFANFTIIVLTYFLEHRWLKGYKLSMSILYEDISLIHRDKHSELLKALQKRTGLNILHYEVEKIDYLRDTAKLKVFYE